MIFSYMNFNYYFIEYFYVKPEVDLILKGFCRLSIKLDEKKSIFHLFDHKIDALTI
jgi:hypothetical protein